MKRKYYGRRKIKNNGISSASYFVSEKKVNDSVGSLSYFSKFSLDSCILLPSGYKKKIHPGQP